MIYNKSTHPIEVKKISIRLWSLRDEIEAAIGRRMKECEAAGIPLYIDDIKKFYNLNLYESLSEQANVLQLPSKNSETDSMASLMESISEETQPESAEATPSAEEKSENVPEAAGAEALKTDGEGTDKTADNQTFDKAEEIIAEQTKQGLETDKPNAILIRPFLRQPPDLDKISYGFTLLADINMESILSFTKDKFLQGQSVVVEFLIPQNFMMTAEVTYCHYYALRSRIISSTKPDYRLQCKFSFAVPGERDTLRNFLKSIEPTLPIGAKKIKKEVSDDDSLGL